MPWNFNCFGPSQFLAIFYIETLLARYLKNHWSYCLDICHTYWGWDVDYLINFWGNSVKDLLELWSFAIFSNFWHWNHLENYLSEDLDIKYTNCGWGVDYLINFWTNSIQFWHKISVELWPCICWGHSVWQTLALVLYALSSMFLMLKGNTT